MLSHSYTLTIDYKYKSSAYTTASYRVAKNLEQNLSKRTLNTAEYRIKEDTNKMWRPTKTHVAISSYTFSHTYINAILGDLPTERVVGLSAYTTDCSSEAPNIIDNLQIPFHQSDYFQFRALSFYIPVLPFDHCVRLSLSSLFARICYSQRIDGVIVCSDGNGMVSVEHVATFIQFTFGFR